MRNMYTHFINYISSQRPRIHHILGIFGVIILGIVATFAMRSASVQASWMWGNFVSQDFRNQWPSNGNILYAFFGDGTPGSTPYTRLWTESCIPTTVQVLPPSFAGQTLQANTLYLLNAGSYTLTSPLVLSGCSALIGVGRPEIKSTNANYLSIQAKSKIIIDNILFNGQSLVSSGILISGSQNIALHATDFFQHMGLGPIVTNSTRILLDSASFYTNTIGLSLFPLTGQSIIINNTKMYNNKLWLLVGGFASWLPNEKGQVSINNSQFFNNGGAVVWANLPANSGGGMIIASSWSVINNTSIYNNLVGLRLYDAHAHINSAQTYNNSTWRELMYSGNLSLYGNNPFYTNTTALFLINTWANIQATSAAGIWWTMGSLDTGASLTMNYDRVTNPQNLNDVSLLSGIDRTSLRWPQPFLLIPQPLRYIFGSFIPHQIKSVYALSWTLMSYWALGQDYSDAKYIGELDPPFTTAEMSIVNQYFGSWSPYTQNRDSNTCSPASFHIVYLNPSMVSASYILQDHTIYFLTWDTFTFIGNTGFVFGGNCIALVGTDTTKIDKNNGAFSSLIYANNKHHIIVDNLRLDGYYWAGTATTPAAMGIDFDAYTDNTTINHVQAYNMQQYGIFLGIGAHHNSIINSQVYNNGEAGIYLYLSSNYNVINNDQAYNNSGYGIWFANGSHHNAMNNFQSYNNNVGVFADLTTSDNIINRAMLYNNKSYGLSLRNSSGNILNDVKIYNNTIGIKTLFNSTNNVFLGQLMLFDNLSGDFEGTNGNDGALTAWTAVGPFANGAKEILGAGLMGCPYVTNPTLSGTSVSLLDTGANCSYSGANLSVFSWLVWDITYLFGANIYKQSVPVYYASGASSFATADNQYDSGKYIAEVFPIRDTTPENLSFDSTGNMQLMTAYTTSVYTAGIINTTVPVTLQVLWSTGHLIINGISAGTSGTVRNGDGIKIVILSKSWFSQTCTGIVTVWNATTSFTVTTRDPIVTPTTWSFVFASITWVQLDSFVPSFLTTIQGIETGVIATFSSSSSGWIEIYTGNQLVSSWATGMVVNGNQIRIVLKSSTSYQEFTTGTLSIGQWSGTFSVQTFLDTIPPEVSFTDDVSVSGYWSENVRILFTGANVFSGYQLVSTPSACSGSLSTTGWIPYTTGLILSGQAANNQYVCAYAKDIGNNVTTGISAYPLHLTTISFLDDVSPTPVNFDTISIGNEYLLNKQYALVSASNQCVSWGATFTSYSWSAVFNSFLYNGKYICAYGEDASGSGRYLLSSASLNIDPNMPSLIFTDPVNSWAGLSDSISLQVIGGLYTQLGYKYTTLPSDCSSTGTVAYTGTITLQTEQYNGKYFCAYVWFSGYTLTLSSTYPINIDRTAPSTPTIIAPLNQADTFFLILQASGSVDTGAGISGYTYQIAQDSSFLDVVYTWTTVDASNFSPIDFDTITGTYYRRIQAIDRLWTIGSRGSGWSFTLTEDTTFHFDAQDKADIDTDYDSSQITVSGLSTWAIVRASVDKWSLFKNQRNKGIGSFVQNGDILSIRLTSSPKRWRSLSSTLTIANRSAEYLITTRDANGASCTVSSSDKQAIQIIFDNLITQYTWDQSKYAEFLSTMKSMLQDKIDLTNDCNLTYLSDLVSQGIDQWTIDTQAHIAPNCKTYAIAYSTGKLAYSSPSLKNVTYFATRDALTRFIDSKNPGDCHINTYTTTTSIFANTDPSKHIAPNGKVYTINTTTSNGYTSPDLSQTKYFSSISALRTYLDSKNPPQKVWNHVIDKSFTPLTYLAPNGKQYSIYKTDRWYMSYKLMQVKYFSTLADIKAYIVRNNAK